MQRIVGIIIVIACVLGGYVALGGHLAVLWQPFEFVIIFGSSCGAFVLGNSKHTISASMKGLKGSFGKPKYGKDEYQEMLVLLFTFLRLMKTKGALALETHIE